MTDLTANFDLGSNGADVLASDPGSLTAWDLTNGASGTMVYDNTHVATGSVMAAKCTTGYAAWTTAYGLQQEHWERFYCYFTANPAGLYTFGLWDIGGGANLRVRVNGSGQVELTLGGAVYVTSANVVNLNSYTRVETHLNHNPGGLGTGVFECRLFLNPDSATPTESFNGNGQDTGNVPADELDVGNVTSQAGNAAFWLDWIANSQVGWIGPAGPPLAQQAVVAGPGALLGRVGSR